MAQGNKKLGICELVERLQDLLPLLYRVVNADNCVDTDEHRLITEFVEDLRSAQDLAARELIAHSLTRGLDGPPNRLLDLLDDYLSTYQQHAVPQAA